MYFKKIETLLLCATLTLTLCSCNANNANHSDNIPTTSISEHTVETVSSDPASEEYRTVSITNEDLGYRFEVAAETANILVCGTNSEKTTASNLTYTCLPYYLNLGDLNQYAFTIYQMEGNTTDDKLIQHSPVLHLLARSTGYTYAISYAEETPAELTPEESQVYATILYKEVPELANHFHII